MNIGQLVRRHAWARPSAPGFTCGGHTYTWQETNQRVNRLAARLSCHPRGTRVAILSPTCHRYWEVHFALAKLALVGVPVNHRLDDAEVHRILSDAGAAAIVWCRDLTLSEGTVDGRDVISFGEHEGPGEDYERLVEAGPAGEPERQVDDRALHVLGYTSGTTGLAKGAIITHRASTMAGWVYAQALGLTESDHVLACMPGYVYRGGSGGYAPAFVGAHTVVTPFDADRVLELLRQHQVSQATFAPAMATRLLNLLNGGQADGARLRALWLTGAPASPGMFDELRRAFHCDVGASYGMTEASGIAMIRHDPRRPDLLTSVGRPLPLLDVQLLDEAGEAVPSGAIGEITVRGETVTAGYWNDPALTARSMRNGWFRTGDYAYRDDEGYLFIVDRRADIIITGGLNVYSAEVERALSAHPSVSDVAVVGAPDDEWGEVPVAFVVGQGLSEPALIEWSGSVLARYKRPRRVMPVPALPRNEMGKVDKRSLRNTLWAGRSRLVN